MPWQSKEDCETQVEEIASRGLLIWKCRGTVPPEGADQAELESLDGDAIDEAHAIPEESLHDSDNEQRELEPKPVT
eukprot:5262379-Amphidinium_carterae.1